MDGLKYLNGFGLGHLKHLFDNVVEVNEGKAKDTTTIFLRLGLETFELRIDEKIEAAAFKKVLNLIESYGETEKPNAEFEVLGGNKLIYINQIQLISIDQLREALRSLFTFLIEEGRRSEVNKFIEQHQTWLVDLFGCLSKVFFLPGGLPNTEDPVFIEAMVQESSIVKSVYSVVR